MSEFDITYEVSLDTVKLTKSEGVIFLNKQEQLSLYFSLQGALKSQGIIGWKSDD